MAGDRKITRYVEAARELQALKAQLAADPERRLHPRWMEHYNSARVEADAALGALTGGQLARAQTVLGGPAWSR